MTKATAEAIKAEVSKVYIANTYIFRGGSLRHTDKEFKTAIAAYKYLHKKMINYAGTTDATQTIEEYDGKTSTKIYENSTNGTEEKTTNAEIQTLIDKWNAEIDARITAKETNALMIAYLDEYAVSVDAQEVAIDAEIKNANKAKAAEKVAKLQELKKDLKGKILVENDLYAENIIDRVLGRVEKNETKSENVGYDILENGEGDWVSILGEDRWEINLASGETFNVWIDEIACVAESHFLSFLGFLLNGLIEQGNDDRAAVLTNAIEYKLKDKSVEDKNFWRRILGLNPEEKLNEYFDDYVVDVDAAVEVEIENAKNAENAAEVVKIDLSNSGGSSDAEKTLSKVLSEVKINRGDYALVNLAHRMIAYLAEDDKLTDRLVAEGKISRENYELTAYTVEEVRGFIELKDLDEMADARTLMDFAGVNSDDYEIRWGKGIIRAFHFNRNAVAKVVIYALNLAGIKADGKINYLMIEPDPETPDNDNNVRNVGNVGNVRNVDSVNSVNSLKEKILANADILRAKLAEQKSRPRKRIICLDEDDFHNNVTFSEISNLQKNFKKFLKLGQLNLAENVFNEIKHIFQAAA